MQQALREFPQEASQSYNQMMESYESFALMESRKIFLFIPDLSEYRLVCFHRKRFLVKHLMKSSFFCLNYSTCFNRIDLPVYSSKNELREKLKVAIESSATGFDIE